MFDVPPAHERLADQIDGWLDLRCPDKAMALLQPLLDDPAARAAGLSMRVRAQIRLGHFRDALPDLAELARLHPTEPWVALTDAWCRKRTGDLRGAIAGLRALLQHDHRNDVAHFNLACYLALTGERAAAIDALTLACGLNPEHRDFARDEPDFDSLRTDPTFRQLLRGSAHGASDDYAADGDEGGLPGPDDEGDVGPTGPRTPPHRLN